MKIRGVTVRIPPMLLGVTVLFAAMCAMLFGATKDVMYVYLAVPLCVILITVPLYTTYMSEKQLLEQEKSYRARAKFLRAKQVTPALAGSTVILEGKILKVSGVLMGKPAYLLMDATGQVVVKRFAFPEPLIGVGAQVEVLGTVAKKLTSGDVVFINAITIRPVKQLRGDEEAVGETPKEPEKIRVKKYH